VYSYRESEKRRKEFNTENTEGTESTEKALESGWGRHPGVLYRCEKKEVARRGICNFVKRRDIFIDGGNGGICKVMKTKERSKLLQMITHPSELGVKRRGERGGVVEGHPTRVAPRTVSGIGSLRRLPPRVHPSDRDTPTPGVFAKEAASY
jgi:hypothetical protein